MPLEIFFELEYTVVVFWIDVTLLSLEQFFNKMAASKFAQTFVEERRKRLNLNNKTLYKNKGAAKIFVKIFKDYLKCENEILKRSRQC